MCLTAGKQKYTSSVESHMSEETTEESNTYIDGEYLFYLTLAVLPRREFLGDLPRLGLLLLPLHLRSGCVGTGRVELREVAV